MEPPTPKTSDVYELGPASPQGGAAGFASPYHMHRNEDESFYLVEGEMTFYVGEERVKAEAGAFVYGPRGVPHGFEVDGTEPARILLQNYPAGFERFPVEVGEPAKELSIPTRSHPTWIN